MRRAFVEELCRLAEADPQLVLLTGDLGFMVLEPFANAFPERFFNVGAAEQNMMAMATGLAEAGWRPYVYSIAPFATLRALEFLRNGPVHHRLPVRVVSVGGGFAYGFGGKSHYSTEDFACLRPMHELLIVAPADPDNAVDALRQTHAHPGPVFYRLDKNDQAKLPIRMPEFRIGDLAILERGDDCSLIAMGAIAVTAAEAAARLRAVGIEPTLAVVTTFNPAPASQLLQLPGPWLTIEEHATVGGLGGWAAETATAAGLQMRLHRCGVSESLPFIGSQSWMRSQHHLAPETIAATVQGLLRSPQS